MRITAKQMIGHFIELGYKLFKGIYTKVFI